MGTLSVIYWFECFHHSHKRVCIIAPNALPHKWHPVSRTVFSFYVPLLDGVDVSYRATCPQFILLRVYVYHMHICMYTCAYVYMCMHNILSVCLFVCFKCVGGYSWISRLYKLKIKCVCEPNVCLSVCLFVLSYVLVLPIGKLINIYIYILKKKYTNFTNIKSHYKLNWKVRGPLMFSVISFSHMNIELCEIPLKHSGKTFWLSSVGVLHRVLNAF